MTPAANDRPRHDGRAAEALRPFEIVPGYLRHAEGSASIRMGGTWVLCAATVEDRQPFFLKQQGISRGWVTSEYGMLPRAVDRRHARGRPGGRETEIQRLVSRSLRAVTNLDRLPLHTITVDCDVIEADGGTRAAAITGAFVALCEACRWMVHAGRLPVVPVHSQVAAISAGIVAGRLLADLDYPEDSEAEVDLTLAGTEDGRVVGLQANVETEPLAPERLAALQELARDSLAPLFAAQRTALGLGAGERFDPRRLAEVVPRER